MFGQNYLSLNDTFLLDEMGVCYLTNTNRIVSEDNVHGYCKENNFDVVKLGSHYLVFQNSGPGCSGSRSGGCQLYLYKEVNHKFYLLDENSWGFYNISYDSVKNGVFSRSTSVYLNPCFLHITSYFKVDTINGKIVEIPELKTKFYEYDGEEVSKKLCD